MAPANSTGDPATPSTPVPSEKQMRFLSIVMQSVKEKPNIDWDKVVALSGHKNVKSAKESYRVMEGRLGLSSAGSPSSPTKVKKRTGKVGTKAAPQGTKARGKKANNNKKEEDDDEDGIASEGGKASVKNQKMEEGV